ncbi:unnamed protein product, partial [Vitis vinifera]
MYLQPVIPFVNCLQFEAVSFFEPEVYRFSDESLSAYAKCAFDDIYRNQKISRIFFSSKYIYLNQKVSTTASVFVSYTDARVGVTTAQMPRDSRGKCPSRGIHCRAGRLVSTYEIVVRMFCNEERVDMALRVWDEMKAKGVLPGMHMFSTLINSLCYENKLDEACKYFHEMLDMGIRPPAAMFSNLKQTLLDEGKQDMVLILAQKLDKIRTTQVIG